LHLASFPLGKDAAQNAEVSGGDQTRTGIPQVCSPVLYQIELRPHFSALYQKAKPAEPLDVPAIQEHHKQAMGTKNCHAASDDPKNYAMTCETIYDEWDTLACADKTRILMHDEQDPPRWWRHKVEAK
jgi:hypothetical protein